MKVAICGPNLNDQTKGQFHVHAAGCADLKNYGPGKKMGGQDQGWVIDADTLADVALNVYDFALDEAGVEEGTAEADAVVAGLVSDFHVLDCAKELTK
jgi:hypothetical protein